MSNYRIFLVKGVIFVILLFLADWLVGKLFLKIESIAVVNSPYGMASEYTLWEVKTDGIIVGSSEALHSYNPRLFEDRFGFEFYNCGLEGTGFYYSASMIDGILKRYSPKMIIWAIEPNVLHSLTDTEKERLSELAPFYRSNDVANRILKKKSKYESIKLLSNAYAYNSRLLPYLYKIVQPDYAYEYGRFAPMKGELTTSELPTKEWTDILSIEVKEEMERLIDRCKDVGIRLVFVMTPRFESGDYNKLTTYKELQNLCQEKGITIIDELYHDESLLQPCYFRDKSHLNIRGTELFNERLLKLLN